MGWEGGSRKYNTDLRACKGAQRFCFDTWLECSKYAVLVAGYKPRRDDASKTHLDDLLVNSSGEGALFTKVDINFLKGQMPVTLKG